jgi:hypothetical protein
MKLEWMKTFVKLARDGAQFKAFQKTLGLTTKSLTEHMDKLLEYEAKIAANELSKVQTVRKVKEVEKDNSKYYINLSKIIKKKVDKETDKNTDEENKTL